MEEEDFCPRIGTDFHGLAPALLSFAAQFRRRVFEWKSAVPADWGLIFTDEKEVNC